MFKLLQWTFNPIELFIAAIEQAIAYRFVENLVGMC